MRCMAMCVLILMLLLCLHACSDKRASCLQAVEEALRPASPEAASPCPKKPRLRLDVPCPVRGIRSVLSY